MAETITLAKSIKNVTDPDHYRYALGGIDCIPRETGAYVAATNGTSLAIVEVEETTIQDRVLIPSDVISRRKTTTVEVNRNPFGDVESFNDSKSGDSVPRNDGRFPAAHKLAADAATIKQPVTIALDAKVLANLADAIRGENNSVALVLETDEQSANYATNVIRVVGDNGIGLIMPVYSDEHTHQETWSRFVDVATDYAKTVTETETATA